MECFQSPMPLASPPAEKGCFSWNGIALAILAVPLFGLVWAWVAHVIAGYVAPPILFPIILGVLAGLSVVGLTRFARLGHRPTIILTALLTALAAASFRHGLGYMAAIDASLAAAAAVAVTMPALQTPYCNRCGSWYRTIRGGKLDLTTALRLAEMIGVKEIGRPRSSRYRFSSCPGKCSPLRFELSWEGDHGAVDLVRVWLDPAAQNQIASILNNLEGEQYDESGATEE